MIKRLKYELNTDYPHIAALMAFMLCIQAVLVLRYTTGGYRQYCIMDGFSLTAVYMGSALIPVAPLASIMSLKNNFIASRVMMEKSVNALWRYLVFKVAVISLVCAAVSTIGCGILGKLLSGITFVWDSPRSAYFYFMDGTLESFPYILLVYRYFIDFFIKTFIISMLSLTSYWIMGSYVPGYVLGSGFSVAGNWFSYGWDIYTGANYMAVGAGLNKYYQYVYPAIIFAVLFILGTVIKRRDFIPKGKDSML